MLHDLPRIWHCCVACCIACCIATQALEWEESQRKVMYDPATADYFLQYTDGKGNKNGTIYQEDIAFGDQYVLPPSVISRVGSKLALLLC